MSKHPVESIIEQADLAIRNEDFDKLMEFYAEDAVLVVKPGVNAVGKEQIRKAFESIAKFFQHSVDVRQAGMELLETGDTVLVLAKTLVSAQNLPTVERKATYVFKKSEKDNWVCAIDNSYGHEILDANA